MNIPDRRLFRRSYMTMVELLVAMAILVILMWVVMRTFSSTQLIWRTTQDTLTTYEDARLAMDLLSRDLRGLVVSRIENEEVNFTLDKAELPAVTNQYWKIAMITSSGIGVEDTTKDLTTEVAYYLETNNDHKDTKLWRAMTSQSDASNWNFTGKKPTVWAAASSFTNFTVVAENVITFSIHAFNDENPAVSMDAGFYDTMPAYFQIEMKLGTYESATDSNVRKFSKTVFLRGQ